MNNYVTGRNREIARLNTLRRNNIAVLGGRFRGSKISKGWIKSLGFNPKLDLWWIDKDGHTHFEQYKTAGKGRTARIDKKEIESVQRFAYLYFNYNSVWVGYVIKNYRQKAKEVRLN